MPFIDRVDNLNLLDLGDLGDLWDLVRSCAAYYFSLP